MSEHDKVISAHEFKEVLHKLVKDAVDKITMKKAGIVGKLKTAKQILIGQDGEATGRDPQQSSSDGDLPFLENLEHPFSQFSHHPTIKDKFICQCDPFTFNSRGQGDLFTFLSRGQGDLLTFFSRGQGNCNLQTRDFNGREWCFLSRRLIPDLPTSSDCSDARPSRELDGFFWSHAACDTRPKDSCFPFC